MNENPLKSTTAWRLDPMNVFDDAWNLWDTLPDLQSSLVSNCKVALLVEIKWLCYCKIVNFCLFRNAYFSFAMRFGSFLICIVKCHLFTLEDLVECEQRAQMCTLQNSSFYCCQQSQHQYTLMKYGSWVVPFFLLPSNTSLSWLHLAKDFDSIPISGFLVVNLLYLHSWRRLECRLWR